MRNRNFHQLKFRRQYPLDPYIVDFVCLDEKLIIEIDGGHHANQVDYDSARSALLRAKGFRVVRFWNNEVLENIEGVYESLTLTLSQGERE